MHTLLIVEDNRDVNELYQTLFTHLQVDYAWTGNEALDALSQNRYNIVLLDLHLPHRSGLDVLEYLRSDPHHQGTVVVVISSDDRLREDAEALGIEQWLTKPISVVELVRVIDRFAEPN